MGNKKGFVVLGVVAIVAVWGVLFGAVATWRIVQTPKGEKLMNESKGLNYGGVEDTTKPVWARH